MTMTRPTRKHRFASAPLMALLGVLSTCTLASPQGPSFPCDDAADGSIEALVCEEAELAALDRRLAEVYGQALEKAGNEHPPVLKAEQRGWIKGRDECWKSDDKRRCVNDLYVRRIAELQAMYRLVPGKGPVEFVCNDNNADRVTVTFFPTEPPTLYAKRGDSVSLMFQQPSGSGARYQGRNESFWEHQGEAKVVWGFEVPEMTCRKLP